MADYTPLILIGGGALAAWYLYSTGALNSLFQQQPQYQSITPYPSQQPMTGQQAPDPNAYYDSYNSIPGINSLYPSAGIVAQAPTSYLMPVPPSPYDSMMYYNPSVWAANKIWEMQYNQLAQTIAVRNQLALMRPGMIAFYTALPWDVDYRNPFLHHLVMSKKVIVDEFHNGSRDSDRANSAAHDAASVVHPITTGHPHDLKTSTNAGPSPGETTPPIRAGSRSTRPTTMAHQAVTTPIAGGAAALPAAPSYDQSKVIPCVTGDC